MRLQLLKSAIGILLMAFAFSTVAQQKLLTQNFASAGGSVSTGGTQRLISVVGQPIAYNSSVATEAKAGFLQAANVLITDSQAPIITPGATPTLTKGSTASFTATITDNIGVKSPQLYYKAITSAGLPPSFQKVDMTPGANNTFSGSITNSVFDNDMGVEYYFKASDNAGNTTTTPATNGSYAYVTVPGAQVPASAFTAGTTVDKYRIIAMPYTSESGEAISTVFGSSSGLEQHKTDKTVWRLATYNATNKKFDEFPDLSTFKRGEGYWFLVKNIKTISLGTKTAPSNNRDNLFKITLKTGWNMIGNPYPIAIKWSDVQNFAGNTPKPGDLNIYDGGFRTSTDLAPFQGGFVNNTGPDLVITIPFMGQATKGGRKSVEAGTDISSTNWQVNLGIYQGNTFNELGRFGMMPTQELKDETLAFNPPAFENAPEINFESNNPLLQKLCKAIVSNSTGSSWAFQATGEIGQIAQLKWNPDLGSGDERLFLLDEQSLVLTNMREVSSYAFRLSTDHRFRIFFGLEAEKIAPQKVLIGAPYPNPATNSKVSFLVGLPESTDLSDVRVQVFNGNGGVFFTSQKTLPSGIHTLTWDTGENTTSGIYYYRVQVRLANGFETATGKIVIP